MFSLICNNIMNGKILFGRHDMNQPLTCFGCRGYKYKLVNRSSICGVCGGCFKLNLNKSCLVCHGTGIVNYKDLEVCFDC